MEEAIESPRRGWWWGQDNVEVRTRVRQRHTNAAVATVVIILVAAGVILLVRLL